MNAPSGDSVPRVLVVDDNPTVLEFLTEVLTTWGPFEVNPCEVETASGVGDARQMLSRNDFDLVLLDMVLGDGNGLQGLRRRYGTNGQAHADVVAAVAF